MYSHVWVKHNTLFNGKWDTISFLKISDDKLWIDLDNKMNETINNNVVGTKFAWSKKLVFVVFSNFVQTDNGENNNGQT